MPILRIKCDKCEVETEDFSVSRTGVVLCKVCIKQEELGAVNTEIKILTEQLNKDPRHKKLGDLKIRQRQLWEELEIMQLDRNTNT